MLECYLLFYRTVHKNNMKKQIFDRLIKSAEQMVAIEKGKMIPLANSITTFHIPNIKKIRANTQLKQKRPKFP